MNCTYPNIFLGELGILDHNLLQFTHRAYDDSRKRAEQRIKTLLLSYAYSSSGSQNQIFKSTEQHRVNGSHFRSIEIGESYDLMCPIRLGEC